MSKRNRFRTSITTWGAGFTAAADRKDAAVDVGALLTLRLPRPDPGQPHVFWAIRLGIRHHLLDRRGPRIDAVERRDRAQPIREHEPRHRRRVRDDHRYARVQVVEELVREREVAVRVAVEGMDSCGRRADVRDELSSRNPGYEVDRSEASTSFASDMSSSCSAWLRRATTAR
jgi:hypothetical protein